MLRIDRSLKTLKRLNRKEIPGAGLKEREDIQQMIRNSPEEFFSEMGEEWLLVGEEVRPTDIVEDRIDLLAIDRQGAAAIIELKRRDHKLLLLQALSYASMVSRWAPERFVDERSKLLSKPRADVEDEIEQHLSEDFGTLNQSQRVILIAEGFDWEVLATCEWLTEKHDVDIRCYRLSLAADSSTEYLSCTCIFPPPELRAQAVRRRAVEKRPSPWDDWASALKDIENPAIVSFFQSELDAGRENYLRRRMLHYRIGGRRMYFVSAHRKAAYVWQQGRFPDDERFWTERLGDDAEVKPVKEARRLRFFLQSDGQFNRFRQAIAQELDKVRFAMPENNEDSNAGAPDEE